MDDRSQSSSDPRADLEAGKQKARELADQATQRAKSEAEARKAGAAGQVDRMASAVERAAEELDPTLSRYASDLAGSMHGIAGRLRDRSVDQLADDVRQLARQNPTLFVLGSIGVGLALSRFLKASPRRQHSAGDSDLDTATGMDVAQSGAGTPVPGAVSASAYEPPLGTTANPWSEPAFGSTSGNPMDRPDTMRGTEH
jgi:hypothetical protein